MRYLIIGLIALTLAGCASYSRMMSYGDGGIDDVADAKFKVEGRSYSLWIHRRENMIMLQRDGLTTVGKGFVRGLTYGIAEMQDPYEAWKGAATAFVAPTGCTVQDVRPITQESAWEAAYTCPPGVDLRALVVAQRAALRRGDPIHP